LFDFFKDMALELQGIDADAAKAERKHKRETEQKEKFIFTKKMKTMIIVLGILYLLMVISLVVTMKNFRDSVSSLVVYSILGVTDIVVLISLIFGKKKGEFVALVGIFLFLCGLFLSVLWI